VNLLPNCIIGNDFTLDINNPPNPRLSAWVANPPENANLWSHYYRICLPLGKAGESKRKTKSSLIFDEFPTIYLNNMDNPDCHSASNK
jgi:hypothetical protein